MEIELSMASRSRARSGTFFLRKVQDTNGATMATSSIDISSFVNVLEGELLRVKQIWWDWTSDNGGPVLGADVGGATKGSSAQASVSSESRTTVGSLENNSVLAKNTLFAATNSNTQIDFITDRTSVNPKDFDDGFLIATDAVHLNVNQSAEGFSNNVRVCIMMECEIVKLSLSDAQAVLVSQTVG